MTGVWLVPAAIWLIAAVVLWAPVVADRRPEGEAHTLSLTVLLALALFTGNGIVAYAAVAVSAALHAHAALKWDRAATVAMALSAAGAFLAAIALWRGNGELAFIGSTAAMAMRVGLVPFHVGTARLADRFAGLQTQQLATTVGLMVAHLRFGVAVPLAYDLAPLFVRYGAVMTLAPALMAMVQRDLRGFYRNATVMHGGMLFAAMGAAGHGHLAAALMVMITTALAMAGVGLMVSALEARVGAVSLNGPGGYVRAFPRLAAAFLIFGGSGVAMPGTAGFIADDLMLHALWEESVIGTLLIIVGSATLAIATLVAYSKVFLGRPVSSLAPDLTVRERWVAVLLVVLLVWLGITPGVLLTPADSYLRAVAEVSMATLR